MKRGIRGHDIRANGLIDVCKVAKETGIEYLQLVLEKTIDSFGYGSFTEEYATELKNAMGDTKVAILGSYINPSNPDDDALRFDLDRFKEKIKYASILNPIAVGTETGIYKEGMTDSEEAYQRVLASIKEVVAEAEKYGVTVGIEGVCWFVINTPKKMKRLLDDLASDNVRVIFDPVNYLNINNYQSQDEMINDAFRLFGEKICVVHAKDFVVEDGEFKFAKPTEGMLNYKLIFDRISEYNLDIPFICEEINEDDANIAFDKMEKIVSSL